MDYVKEKLLVVQQHANFVPSHHPQNAKNALNFPKFSTISQTTWKCKIMYLKHYPLYLGDVVTCTKNREIQSFGGDSCIMWKGWHWCGLNNSWMITLMYQSQVTVGCKSRNSDTAIYNHVKTKNSLSELILPVMSYMVSSSDILYTQSALLSFLQNSDCNQTCNNQAFFSVPLAISINDTWSFMITVNSHMLIR